MKILHTADWHLGKVLHKHSLRDELQLFFSWLFETIKREKVNVLLVSGDIFDLGNPSSQDRELYYSTLTKLNELQIRVIITGGNHDSMGLLNAPKEVLNALNITVIGGAKEKIEDEIVELYDKNGSLNAVVAATPFLRDKDLRNHETDQKYKNRTEAIREGIKKHYATLAEICQSEYKDLPAIAMGHLYAIGADPSDSERDIHMGNEAAIDSQAFGGFDYVALGHIHRPQIIGKNDFVRYSGSPIALSFSEKRDVKSVVVIEIVEKKVLPPQLIEVPKFRELRKMKGSLSEIEEELSTYVPNFPLRSFVELEIIESDFSAAVLAKAEDLAVRYSENESFLILKQRTLFSSGTKDTSDLFAQVESIEDLQPIEVFNKRLEIEGLEDERNAVLTQAFLELLDLVNEEEAI